MNERINTDDFIGTEDICKQCRGAIRFDGRRWFHCDFPQPHNAVPVSGIQQLAKKAGDAGSHTKQLADLFLKSPETGKALKFISPIETQNGFNYFKVGNATEQYVVKFQIAETHRDEIFPPPTEPEFTPELEWILGRPNFWCASVIIPFLRLSGQEIPKKAEDEQAAAIFWMLQMYAKHGKDWREVATNEIETFLAKKRESKL